MHALVTGCAGFIGSHLTEALLESGDSVLGVDCFNDNYGRPEKLRNLERARDWDGFEFVPIDLSRGELEDEVAGCDVIFHLAAEPGVRASWGSRFDRYLRNNVLATQHLLEAAKARPEKRFVFASSSSIYGQAEKLPTRETDTPQPFSPYGTTKLAAEHLCQLYHRNYGVETVILRYFSVFGPRQRPDMAFTVFSRAAVHGGAVAVFGDGRQTRDFTFVGDIVTATRAAVHAPGAVGGVYNIGGGSRISVSHALSLIQQFAGRPLEITHLPPQEGDVHDTGADTARAQADLGYWPRTDFEQGLRAQFDWVVANAEAPDKVRR
jgi:UDP-glucuronate 4-epimerase